MPPLAYVAGLDPDDPFAVLADAARTGSSMGVVVCTWLPGQEPPSHSMPRTDHAFIVLSGACVLTVDGRDLPTATGELAFVPRRSRVTVRVTHGPCRVLVVLVPAGPEAYFATAAGQPGIGTGTRITLAADHGVVVHLPDTAR